MTATLILLALERLFHLDLVSVEWKESSPLDADSLKQ